jgi:hypothetical protein
MTLEPFKYIVQPVALERDEDGKVVREVPAEPVSAYSVEQVLELVRAFEDQLTASQNGKPSLLVPGLAGD